MDVNRTRKMRRPNSNLPKIKPQVIATIIGCWWLRGGGERGSLLTLMLFVFAAQPAASQPAHHRPCQNSLQKCEVWRTKIFIGAESLRDKTDHFFTNPQTQHASTMHKQQTTHLWRSIMVFSCPWCMQSASSHMKKSPRNVSDYCWLATCRDESDERVLSPGTHCCCAGRPFRQHLMALIAWSWERSYALIWQ